MTDEDRLAERAGDREDRYLQALTKARNEAEKVYDLETIAKLEKLYEETIDKIEGIDNKRRQKVVKSQIWALEQEIGVYSEAIEKVRVLVVK